MSDGFDGKYYTAITALEEDVDLLLKRATELIRTQNKCSNEVEALSSKVAKLDRSNEEVTLLLQDMRSMVTKETVQRLYSQLSTELGTEIVALVGQAKSDVKSDVRNDVAAKIGQLQEDLVLLFQHRDLQAAGVEALGKDLEEMKRGLVRREEVREMVVGEVGARVRNEVGSAVGPAVEVAVGSAVASAVGVAVETAVTSAVGPAVEVAVTSAVVPAVDTALSAALGPAIDTALSAAVSPAIDTALSVALGPAVDASVSTALSAVLGPAVDASVSTAVAIAVSTAISSNLLATPLPPQPATIPLPPEVTLDSLQSILSAYLKKDDAIHESDIRHLLSTTLHKKDLGDLLAQISSLYVNRKEADASYLTRAEFDALKTIIVTRNDLQTLGKNELDELRKEQEMMKRSVPTRDHLKLLRTECETLRDTCNILDEKIKRLAGGMAGTMVSSASSSASSSTALVPVDSSPPPVVELPILVTVTPPSYDELTAQLKQLQQRVEELDSRCLATPSTLDIGHFKYIKVGDLRFLMSNGFVLREAEESFPLAGIELPGEGKVIGEGNGYEASLTAEGVAVFKRVSGGEGEGKPVEVTRFIFWY